MEQHFMAKHMWGPRVGNIHLLCHSLVERDWSLPKVPEQHETLGIMADMMCSLWGSLPMLWAVHAPWSCISYTATISFGTRKMEWDVRTKHCRKTWDEAGRLAVLSYYLITSHVTSLTSTLEPMKLWKIIPGCSMTWEPGRLMHVLFCPVYTLLVKHVSNTIYFLSSSELLLFH